MAVTIVKTLTDKDSTATFADQAAWEAVHGPCGGAHASVQSYSIAADGTHSVELTRVFATEDDWVEASTNPDSNDGAAPNWDMGALVSDSRDV